MNTQESYFSPIIKYSQENNFTPDYKNESENISNIESSFTKNRFTLHCNEISNGTLTSHKEQAESVIESSELAIRRYPARIGERLSTIMLTSESVLSRNKLQECSMHLEKLCENKNTLMHSKKFEEQLNVEDIPGLYVPVFTARPTIAFCNRCGRDVKTRVRKIEPKLFEMKFADILCCCVPNYIGVQDFIHVCSRCRAELVKITI